MIITPMTRPMRYFTLPLLFLCANALAFAQLRIVSPNGGEKFLAGSDTTITWAGVKESDTVALDYTTDDGGTWKSISSGATGLHYLWRVPNSPSNECRVRLRTAE